ncbi:PE-PPE domain-containing protein [Mycolicibacterium anyangense]|nr:PE-PPE domain-containing protein [Mycolicibacterium anyangense]
MSAARRPAIAGSALLAVAAVGSGLMGPALVAPTAWAATSALIMGGTGHSLASPPDTLGYVEDYLSAAVDKAIAPASEMNPATGIPQGPYNRVAVITPEQAAPSYGTLTVDESVALGVTALHSCITSTTCDYNQQVGSVAPTPSDTLVVFGYSQSAVIAMLEKAALAAEYGPGQGPNVSFVVSGDTKRPNGGLYARDPSGVFVPFVRAGGYTFGGAAPTDTQYATVDIAIQYDGLVDFPVNPLNLLAVVNAYMGMALLHSTYGDRSLSEPGIIDQGQYGDTHYYLGPTPVLPLLMPLQAVPLVGAVLADVLDAPLRVLVEASYDRSTSPGQPVPFNLLYFPHPLKTALDVLVAIPTGLDNGFEDVFGVRPFHTERPGPFGVGGPDVDLAGSAPAAVSTPAASSTSHAAAGTSVAAGRSGRQMVSADPEQSPSVAAPGPAAPVRAGATHRRAASAARSENRPAAASSDHSTGRTGRG